MSNSRSSLPPRRSGRAANGEARLLWYSLGSWFAPSASEFEVVELLPTMTDDALATATLSPYMYFFEPTPYPAVNNYDPIRMAKRLARVGQGRPFRAAAFACHPSPTPFEAQCAFAAQTGRLLGVTPEIHLVAVATHGRARDASGKKGVDPEGRPQQIDPGPEVDWRRAIDAALRSGAPSGEISALTHKLVACYLFPRRGGPGFSPTQRRLLHRASTGDIGVIAEEVAQDLHVQLVTAQRAIQGIAAELFTDEVRRRSPELVGRLVARYAWFLQYNEF